MCVRGSKYWCVAVSEDVFQFMRSTSLDPSCACDVVVAMVDTEHCHRMAKIEQ